MSLADDLLTLVMHPDFAELTQFSEDDWLIVMQVEGRGRLLYRGDGLAAVVATWKAGSHE